MKRDLLLLCLFHQLRFITFAISSPTFSRVSLLIFFVLKGCVERANQLVSHGANPLIGKKSLNQNGLHALALACTQADYSEFLSSLSKKVG